MRTVGLIAFGMICWLVACYFLFSGFTLNTAVGTDAGDVANLQLMHVQSVDFVLGVGAAIVGSIHLCAAEIIGAIEAKKTEPTAAAGKTTFETY